MSKFWEKEFYYPQGDKFFSQNNKIIGLFVGGITYLKPISCIFIYQYIYEGEGRPNSYKYLSQNCSF